MLGTRVTVRGYVVGLFCIVFFVTSAEAAPHACAHRGDSKNAPENTLPALVSAVKKGAHMVEFDVQETQDGGFILMHDLFLDRTTNGSGWVGQHTLEHIRALDAGAWFSPAFAGTKVPTLQEALQAVPSPILMNVHLKETVQNVAGVVQCIKDLGKDDQCVLACTPAQAEKARSIESKIKICNMNQGLGGKAARRAYVDDTLKRGAAFIQFFYGNGTEDIAEDIARLHAHGVQVNYYYSNEAEEMRALAEAGVDYILTDELDLCLEVCRAFGTEPVRIDNVAKTELPALHTARLLFSRSNGVPGAVYTRMITLAASAPHLSLDSSDRFSFILPFMW